MKNDSWIRTYSGGKLYYFEPENSNITLEDVSHGLSMICRFNGQCNQFYSVAEHSILVANHVFKETRDKRAARSALMHDASEAFISDVPSPFKKYFEGFIECEKRMEAFLAQRFNYDFPYPPVVKEHDLKALSTEMRDLMNVEDNQDLPRPYGKRIKNTLEPNLAKRLFEISFSNYLD